MGKATPHPADRQPCGYKSTHSEAQSPAPGTSRFEIEWDILEGQERSWGWVLGLSFLCSVVCFVSVVRSRLFVCTFWLHNLVFK
jgi:hypothetical protein